MSKIVEETKKIIDKMLDMTYTTNDAWIKVVLVNLIKIVERQDKEIERLKKNDKT